MALWKKKVNGWPPDDPPNERKLYQDSLVLYNNNNIYNERHKEILLNHKTDYEYATKMGYGVNWDNAQILRDPILKNASNKINTILVKHPTWEPIKIVDPGFYNMRDGAHRNLENVLFFANPTGNALKTINSEKPLTGLNTFPKEGRYYYSYVEDKWIPELSKLPIIKPELQTSLIKFRPPTPLPEGNVELQNTGYTNIGMKKKPDGTRFIYDKSGKTDKTIIIDDNRIGFEHYIKKLYE